MNEIWKVIENHPSYSVSNIGRVKNNKTNRILKQDKSNRYCSVKLDKQNCLVHRLVAQYFIENPNNFNCVNHKDECKTNNSVENLEWCSHQYNTEYSCGKKVLQLDSEGNVIKEWNSISEASRAFGIHHTVIFGCCNNTTGFNWKYAD